MLYCFLNFFLSFFLARSRFFFFFPWSCFCIESGWNQCFSFSLMKNYTTRSFFGTMQPYMYTFYPSLPKFVQSAIYILHDMFIFCYRTPNWKYCIIKLQSNVCLICVSWNFSLHCGAWMHFSSQVPDTSSLYPKFNSTQLWLFPAKWTWVHCLEGTLEVLWSSPWTWLLGIQEVVYTIKLMCSTDAVISQVWVFIS